MPHWSERYVGRPYVDGQFDCIDLSRVVQLEVFGRQIRVPGAREYWGLGGPAKFRAMARQIEEGIPEFAERTENPVEGDAVLIKARGYLQHVGVYCLASGEPSVLHAADGAMQVILQRIRDLPARGLRVEGYYRWI